MPDTKDTPIGNILIVDDQSANISLLYKLLEAFNFRIAVANSGEKCLELAEKLHPDLILLDVVMPGMDGLETCRRLHAGAATCEIPVVFITGRTALEDIIEGFAAGAVDYITKPFREEEVKARVETHVSLHLLRRERDRLLRQAQQQMSYLQAVFDHAGDGILTVSVDGEEVSAANPALLSQLGFDSINDRSLAQLIGPTAANDICRIASELLVEGESEKLQIAVRRQDGTVFDAEIVLTLMDRDEKRYVGVLHDISKHKQLEDELRQLSTVDGLTGVANRRHFDERLQSEWLRSLRCDAQLGLILLDIDFFKQFNDFYGHVKGDKCLQTVARYLSRQFVRRDDLVARYGGEEFAILVSDTNPKAVGVIIERVRRKIVDLAIPHEARPDEDILTISLGGAVLAANSRLEPEVLIETADKALYQAKHDGRNRGVVYSIDDIEAEAVDAKWQPAIKANAD